MVYLSPAAYDYLQRGICPDCKHDRFVENWREGDRCCARCGLVVEEHMISEEPEWRNFYDEPGEDKSRIGSVVSESGRLATTSIGPGPGSSKLMRMQLRTMKTEEDTYDMELVDLENIMNEVVPSAVKRQQAVLMYKAARTALQGCKSKTALMAACCFFADGAIPLSWMADLFAVDRKALKRAFHDSRQILLAQPRFRDVIYAEEDSKDKKVLNTVIRDVLQYLKFDRMWQVKKLCDRIFDTIRSDDVNGLLTGCKPSCLAASIVVVATTLMHACEEGGATDVVIKEDRIKDYACKSTLEQQIPLIYHVMKATGHEEAAASKLNKRRRAPAVGAPGADAGAITGADAGAITGGSTTLPPSKKSCRC